MLITQQSYLTKCPFCGTIIDPDYEFHNDFSKQEYFRSGLCQKCQNISRSLEGTNDR